MYGLPEDFDTSFLIGRRLDLVCFSANTVNFHFDGGLHFTIESAYAHQSPESGAADQLYEVPVLSSNIMQLLESLIIDGSATADGTLILTFDNGHKLKFLDTSKQYESYKIDHDDITIIV
jgi:hypothetical protein